MTWAWLAGLAEEQAEGLAWEQAEEQAEDLAWEQAEERAEDLAWEQHGTNRHISEDILKIAMKN